MCRVSDKRKNNILPRFITQKKKKKSLKDIFDPNTYWLLPYSTIKQKNNTNKSLHKKLKTLMQLQKIEY
uniref:Uncharacterized protein n=1 Tax=Nyssomyia neivai TaxID=330878 RepID=A0A1L8D896_9DIPT